MLSAASTRFTKRGFAAEVKEWLPHNTLMATEVKSAQYNGAGRCAKCADWPFRRMEMADELDLSTVYIPIKVVAMEHLVSHIRRAGRCPNVFANLYSGFGEFL